MARFWMCGFETGQLTAELSTFSGSANPTLVGSVAIESTTVRTGSYSMKATPASGSAGYFSTGTSIFGGHVRFYARVTARPASTKRLVYGTTTAGGVRVSLNPDGTLELANGTNTQTSTTALTDTTRWYCIEVANLATSVLWVDGAQEASIASSTAATGNFGAADTTADTYTVYFDDCVYDNADVYIGPGNVLLSRPVSLNSAGGWVEGDGSGTAGMAAAVATRPPPGVASASETSATNIESPTNSATDDCDFNMQSYLELGICPGSTITSVRVIVRAGEDISTGTKNGAITVVSNPTQASETTFVYGADGGAHGAEGGIWKTVRGSGTNGDTVVLGTRPVVRVGKRTATTRVVCVDFLGLYIDYIPGPMPHVSPYPQLLAH